MSKNKVGIFLMILLLTITIDGCMYALRYDGTYRGKVVDETTREPIEGVVALGVWYKTAPTVAGAVSTYYDARETVTDKNGEFEIPGQGLRIMTDLAPMEIMVFKAGYNYIGLAPWEGLKTGITLSKKVKWEGEKPIIPLKKLTVEDIKKPFAFPSEPCCHIPADKMKIMMKEIQSGRKMQGLD